MGDIFNQFGIDWPKFIATCVNFLIVTGVLYWFAYKPILSMLEERKRRIAEGIENAEKIKRELAATEEQRIKTLAAANTQAQRLIDEARQSAEQARERTVAEARQQAEAELRRAQQQIAVDRDRMLTDARREVLDLVVATTARVSGRVLTPDDHQRLAEETARELRT